MQVTKENFPAVLPHFLELLKTCDFYAFDEEMTGINVPEVKESITGTPEDSYESKRLAAHRFSIIQVGVCLFHKAADAEEKGEGGTAAAGPLPGSSTRRRQQYVARPFNFVLFPNYVEELSSPQKRGSSTEAVAAAEGREVVLSPSALAFLQRHGMDFQQWVYRGIGYGDSERERLLRRHLVEKYAEDGAGEATASAPPLFFTDEEKAWVTESIAAAEALAQRVREADAAADTLPAAVEREVLLKPQTSRNAREHVRQHVKSHLPTLAVSFRRQGSGGRAAVSTVLTALSEAEASRNAEREAALRQRETVDVLGFRLVFSALVESAKPCAGHNCFADLLFLMAALDQPLPSSLAAWKRRAATLFPCVYDTKYLVSRTDLFPPGRFPANYLGGLFAQFGFRSPLVEVTLPVGFEAYDPVTLLSKSRGGGASGAAHEAAFDALMTGTLLLNLLAEVGVDVAAAAGSDGGAEERALLSNKIALFRSLYAVVLPRHAGGSREWADEYVPGSDGVVLDLTHEATLKTPQLESYLAAGGVDGAVLYAVDEHRTLALVPRAPRSSSDGADAVAAAVASRWVGRAPRTLQVRAYVPPHRRTAPTAGAKFSFPSASAATTIRAALKR